MTEPHLHPHETPHRKHRHHHHPHGAHPHPQVADHHHAYTTPPPPPPPGDCEGVEITGTIQTAIDAHPAGTTFCLSGSYTLGAPLRPKNGQRFVGPATILAAGGATNAFALKTASAEDVWMVGLDVSGFSESAIHLWVGAQVIGGRYHDNPTNGIGGGLEGGGGILIDGVEVDNNGSTGELGSSSGGIKVARTHGITVRNCDIHDNIGNGVWADVQCGNYTIVDNRVIHNSRKGIHYEKSGESDEIVNYVGFATIARNTVQQNGWENREHAADGGITLVSSKNALIENNVLGDQTRQRGIVIRQDGRLDGEKHGWVISNVTIRNNTMNGDAIVGCDLAGVTCD